MARVLRHLRRGHGSGGGARTTDTIERLLGRPPRTFDDFARNHASAFG
jgi:hypothetical protein